MNFDLDLSIDVLARTPSALQSLLGGLTDPWIRGTEGPNTFSPFDVVGHLIDGEETDWMPRARIILARGESLRRQKIPADQHTGAGQQNSDRSPTAQTHESPPFLAGPAQTCPQHRLSKRRESMHRAEA